MTQIEATKNNGEMLQFNKKFNKLKLALICRPIMCSLLYISILFLLGKCFIVAMYRVSQQTWEFSDEFDIVSVMNLGIN